MGQKTELILKKFSKQKKSSFDRELTVLQEIKRKGEHLQGFPQMISYK